MLRKKKKLPTVALTYVHTRRSESVITTGSRSFSMRVSVSQRRVLSSEGVGIKLKSRQLDDNER